MKIDTHEFAGEPYDKEETAKIIGHPYLNTGKKLYSFLRAQCIFHKIEIVDNQGATHKITVPLQDFVDLNYFSVENRTVHRKSLIIQTQKILFSELGIAFVKGMLYPRI